MSCVVDTIHDKSIEPTEFQALLHYLAHRHLSLRTWKGLSAGIAAIISCGSQEMHLTSILFYIVEGFLPMMTAFCNQLAVANMADVNSKLIRELLSARSLSLLKAVGDGVMVSTRPLTQWEQDYTTPAAACISHSSFTLFGHSSSVRSVSKWASKRLLFDHMNLGAVVHRNRVYSVPYITPALVLCI